MTVANTTIELTPALEMIPTLEITESAASRLSAMMAERQLSDYGLRVFVSGGGCSGLQYGMTFDNETREGDAAWSIHGLRVIVDPISARYLQGASISFQQDNMLAGAFKIDNPNAVASCGCGHSFRTRDEGAESEYEEYDGAAAGGCGHCGA
jgi:iron-sulfur cluster assembly accessory protein